MIYLPIYRSLMFTYIYQFSQINQFATCIYRKSYCSGSHVDWNANLWCAASRKFQLSGTLKVRVSTSLTFRSCELRMRYVWYLHPSSSPSTLCLEIILTDPYLRLLFVSLVGAVGTVLLVHSRSGDIPFNRKVSNNSKVGQLMNYLISPIDYRSSNFVMLIVSEYTGDLHAQTGNRKSGNQVRDWLVSDSGKGEAQATMLPISDSFRRSGLVDGSQVW